LNCTWNETFTLKESEKGCNLIASVGLLFKVMDYDTIGKNDFIGEKRLMVFDNEWLKENKVFKGKETIVRFTLDKVKHGELDIGITPLNFGLEELPAVPSNWEVFRAFNDKTKLEVTFYYPRDLVDGLDDQEKADTKVGWVARKVSKPGLPRTESIFFDIRGLHLSIDIPQDNPKGNLIKIQNMMLPSMENRCVSTGFQWLGTVETDLIRKVADRSAIGYTYVRESEGTKGEYWVITQYIFGRDDVGFIVVLRSEGHSAHDAALQHHKSLMDKIYRPVIDSIMLK